MNLAKSSIHKVMAVLCATGLAGCAGSSAPSNSTTTTPASSGTPASIVYVVENSTGSPTSLPQILQFAAGANGSAAPTSTLTLPSGELIEGVAVDTSGQIYVVGIAPSQARIIQIFAAGASGTATPVRTINYPVGGDPEAMTVDSSGQLYVLDDAPEVLVFSSTANGTAAPTRTISGALTTLGVGEDIAVDSSGSIYVATVISTASTASGRIQVFASGANGNVAPQRVITCSNVVTGVAVDASGDLYAALDIITGTSVTSSIVEYGNTASGAATPTRTITGATTGLSETGALRVDAAGYIYVVVATQQPYYGFNFSLSRFAPSASGNVAPTASLTSTGWVEAGTQIAIR
jgi:hypothetical protein